MKSTHLASSPNPRRIGFEIFHSQIVNNNIQLIQNALTTTYKDILDITIGGELKLPKETLNSKRNQYNADTLLLYLIKIKKVDTALLIIQKDLYCEGMNFIFGYAIYHRGAVLSIYGLSTNELIKKEAIHEVGHILGLKHCSNYCVMQFSNSLWEAKMKPLYLCESCQEKTALI